MRATLTILAGVLVIVVFGLLFPNGSEVEADPAELKVNSLVTMKEYAYGCESPLKFADAVAHQANKETTAWRRIVDDRLTCFNERDSGAKQKWVVLRIDRTAMQIARADDRAGRSYWTAVRWGLVPRKPNEMR